MKFYEVSDKATEQSLICLINYGESDRQIHKPTQRNTLCGFVRLNFVYYTVRCPYISWYSSYGGGFGGGQRGGGPFRGLEEQG